MTEYIEREALIDFCKKIIHDRWDETTAPVSWSHAYADFIDDVNNQPAADVAPVKHGHWQKGDALERLADEVLIYDYTCTCCGWSCRCEGKLDFNFCPNCGADMRENT